MSHQAVPICKQVSWQAPSKSTDGKLFQPAWMAVAYSVEALQESVKPMTPVLGSSCGAGTSCSPVLALTPHLSGPFPSTVCPSSCEEPALRAWVSLGWRLKLTLFATWAGHASWPYGNAKPTPAAVPPHSVREGEMEGEADEDVASHKVFLLKCSLPHLRSSWLYNHQFGCEELSDPSPTARRRAVQLEPFVKPHCGSSTYCRFSVSGVHLFQLSPLPPKNSKLNTEFI